MTVEEYRLEPSKLYKHTDLAQLDFETTGDLDVLEEAIGQSRAVDAIRFGMGIEKSGYNIYALGSSGLDKRGLVRRFFESRAK